MIDKQTAGLRIEDEERMICPACKNPLLVVEYHRIELDYCSRCHGVWFDSGELELLLKSQGQPDSPQPFEDQSKTGRTKSGEKRRRCPTCRRTMDKKTLGQQPQILVDVCPAGDGLWFDGGEVNSLLKTPVVHEPTAPLVPAFLAEVLKGWDH